MLDWENSGVVKGEMEVDSELCQIWRSIGNTVRLLHGGSVAH